MDGGEVEAGRRQCMGERGRGAGRQDFLRTGKRAEGRESEQKQKTTTTTATTTVTNSVTN